MPGRVASQTGDAAISCLFSRVSKHNQQCDPLSNFHIREGGVWLTVQPGGGTRAGRTPHCDKIERAALSRRW
jgi:hypothetical protein